jgi:hypothetical protein
MIKSLIENSERKNNIFLVGRDLAARGEIAKTPAQEMVNTMKDHASGMKRYGSKRSKFRLRLSSLFTIFSLGNHVLFDLRNFRMLRNFFHFYFLTTVRCILYSTVLYKFTLLF